MPSKLTFRIDMTEFNKALRAYMQVTTHSLPDVLNKKAFFIARRAVRETPATPGQKIRSELGRVVRTKKGVIRTSLVSVSKVYSNATGKAADAPLAALIINAREGRASRPGYYGPDMKEAISAMIGARNRSRSYLKSGWLPAIRILDRIVNDRRGEPRADRGAKQYGADKGRAMPATAGFRCKCIIENTASGPHETNQALVKYGEPALQRAFDFEARSMEREVMRRQFEEAKKIGIKVIGG